MNEWKPNITNHIILRGLYSIPLPSVLWPSGWKNCNKENKMVETFPCNRAYFLFPLYLNLLQCIYRASWHLDTLLHNTLNSTETHPLQGRQRQTSLKIKCDWVNPSLCRQLTKPQPVFSWSCHGPLTSHLILINSGIEHRPKAPFAIYR